MTNPQHKMKLSQIKKKFRKKYKKKQKNLKNWKSKKILKIRYKENK